MWFLRRKEIESKIALKTAEESLKKTKERSTDVTEVTEALRNLRERNHFAERLEFIMGGPR